MSVAVTVYMLIRNTLLLSHRHHCTLALETSNGSSKWIRFTSGSYRPVQRDRHMLPTVPASNQEVRTNRSMEVSALSRCALLISHTHKQQLQPSQSQRNVIVESADDILVAAYVGGSCCGYCRAHSYVSYGHYQDTYAGFKPPWPEGTAHC